MAGRGPGLGRERNASPADTAHTGIFRGLKFYLEWTPDAKMFNDILRLIRSNGGVVLQDPSHPSVTHLIVHPTGDKPTKDLVMSLPPPRPQDVAVFNAKRRWRAEDLVAHFARRAAGYPQTTNISKIANYQPGGADASYNKVVIRKEWIEEAIEARTKFHGGDGYAGWEVKWVEVPANIVYHSRILGEGDGAERLNRCTIVAPGPAPTDVPPPPPLTAPPPLPPSSPSQPPHPSSSTSTPRPRPTQSLADRLSKDTSEKQVTATPVIPPSATSRLADSEGRPIAAMPTSASSRLIERLGPPLGDASRGPIDKPFPFIRSNTCPTASSTSPQRPPPAPFGLTRSNTFAIASLSGSHRNPSSQVITDDVPSLGFEWEFASQENASPLSGGETSAPLESNDLKTGLQRFSTPLSSITGEVRRMSVASNTDRKDTRPSLPMHLESWMSETTSQVGTQQTARNPLPRTSSGSIELGRPIPSAPPIRPSPSPSSSSVGGVFSSAYPLPMSFHVVDDGPGKSTLELLITAMGGGVIPTNPASANYIILNLEPGHRATLPEHLAVLHSVRGDSARAVLSSAWINSCIKSGRVVPLEPYVVREAGERLDSGSGSGSGSGSNALSLSLDLPPTPAPSGASDSYRQHYIEVDDSDLDELFSDNETRSVGPPRRHTSPLSSLSPEPEVGQICGLDEEDATPPGRVRSGSDERGAPFSGSRSGGTPSVVPGGLSASGKRRRNEIDPEDQEAYELLLDRLRKRSRGVSAKTFFSRLQSEKAKPYWRGLFRRYDRMIRDEIKGLEGWEP
ncbi:hypothetical protein JCM24511_08855 [Saitozyma sp. JCM 24511]|nr:hypothetical protein JCM24511_08855 [Saitozyma sp. JCM 24511]